jgi:hypothetical protein
MTLKDYLDIITALSAISALFISISAILRSTTDNKKQIIVGKIEEIYELTIFLFVEYSKLNHLATKLDEVYASNFNEFDDNLNDFRILIQDISKTTNLNEIYDKTLRLNVLANSYLNNEIKMEIIAYARLFQCAIATIHLATLDRKNKEFKEGFPTTEKLRGFVEDLTPKLVELINLGGKKQPFATYQNYFETEFKSKLGLKD